MARTFAFTFLGGSPDGPDSYARWIEQPTSDEPPPSRGSIRFCILLTAQNPCLEWLDDAVESIRSQSHAAWELWSAIMGHQRAGSRSI
jgi:hypothetical protein